MVKQNVRPWTDMWSFFMHFQNGLTEINSESMFHNKLSQVENSMNVPKCYLMWYVAVCHLQVSVFPSSHRIHGSVDCLSELSSSRLSHPFSGESSAFIGGFDSDLFEMCRCIYYAAGACEVILSQESVWECLTLVIAMQGQSVAVSAHHRPSPPPRRRAEEALLPGVSFPSFPHGPHISPSPIFSTSS